MLFCKATSFFTNLIKALLNRTFLRKNSFNFEKNIHFLEKEKINKIVLTGPESTGKTTLAQQLASHFQTIWVPEFARSFIDELKRPYEEKDLLKIAKGQVELEDELFQKANGFLFCDTDLIVIKIWSEYQFGNCHPWVLQQIQERTYDLHILCGTDVLWEPDPQREHPHDREKLYFLYKKELEYFNKNYIEITGNEEFRLKSVIEILGV